MVLRRILPVVGVLLALQAPASAAERPKLTCLGKEAQRVAVSSGKAVRLAVAIRIPSAARPAKWSGRSCARMATRWSMC